MNECMSDNVGPSCFGGYRRLPEGGIDNGNTAKAACPSRRRRRPSHRSDPEFDLFLDAVYRRPVA